MFDVFFTLWVTDLLSWFIKLIALTASVLFVLYLVYITWLKAEKTKKPFPVHSKKVFLKAIILTTVIYNIFWFLVLKYNGMYVFEWNKFEMKLSNTYFLILPILISYLILAILFFLTKSRIKKLV